MIIWVKDIWAFHVLFLWFFLCLKLLQLKWFLKDVTKDFTNSDFSVSNEFKLSRTGSNLLSIPWGLGKNSFTSSAYIAPIGESYARNVCGVTFDWDF